MQEKKEKLISLVKVAEFLWLWRTSIYDYIARGIIPRPVYLHQEGARRVAYLTTKHIELLRDYYKSQGRDKMVARCEELLELLKKEKSDVLS